VGFVDWVGLVDGDRRVDQENRNGQQLLDWRFLRAALESFSGKWELAVLAELLEGEHAHCDLLRATGMENKQLARTLHHLEGSCLIERRVRTTYSPVRVCYALTNRGTVLLGALVDLSHRLKAAKWSAQNSSLIGG
jgi:DNA-binding HxlR family transcriptional regulator